MVPVAQIMTKEVVTIAPDATVLDAIDLLTKHTVSGLPVVDGETKLLGIITEKDVLNLLFSDDMGGARVSDYMTRQVTTFKEADKMTDVARFFIRHNVRRVPIIDEDNHSVLCGC